MIFRHGAKVKKAREAASAGLSRQTIQPGGSAFLPASDIGH